MKTNITSKKSQNKPAVLTHYGTSGHNGTAFEELRRSVMACMLWEDTFYESGIDISERISSGVKKVTQGQAASIAIDAREKQHLRHAPLFVVREMARRGGSIVGQTLARVIQRADEIAEYVSIYWKGSKEPLSAQSKLGLAKAFTKFDEYNLAKYNRDADVKLRDVLFLCHAKPKDKEQAKVWERLVAGTLKTPDTWEVALSGGANKRETFERLISEKKLGGLALLRNLRNMQDAGVPVDVIRQAILDMNTSRILPFRFIAAARYAPQLEKELEAALFKSLEFKGKLPGTTVVAVDVSGSMDSQISQKSEMLREDAGSGLAMIIRELCDDVRVFTFSDQTLEVPARRGFALRDAIRNSQSHSGTCLDMYKINKQKYDRIIVLTDEQMEIRDNPISKNSYMVNVASYEHGIDYRKWTHIDGWSDSIVDYILAYEGIEGTDTAESVVAPSKVDKPAKKKSRRTIAKGLAKKTSAKSVKKSRRK